MKILKRLFLQLQNQLNSYSFISDYRQEQAIIQRVYNRYADKMEGSSAIRYMWRAISQYRCQAFARKFWVGWLANAIAIAGLPMVIFMVRLTKYRLPKASCRYLKINFHVAYKIPECIKDFTHEAKLDEKYLYLADIWFAFRMFRMYSILYPELLLKFILWITTVRPYLDRYHVEYLLQYCEFSAYSSLRKAYLNSLGVKIANVTHGEEFISCRSAFSSFDQYFAWELTPPSIHDAMNIECGERFIFNPCAGIPLAPQAGVDQVIGFLWPSLEEEDLNLLVDQLNSLSQHYYVVRPHPNSKYANHFSEYKNQLIAEISDPHTETIDSFIDRTGQVVGYLSAVLIQARLRGRSVLYLKNEALVYLSEYHDYYKTVTVVPLEGLNAHFLGTALSQEQV